MAENENVELGDELIGKRLCPNTKRQYAQKLKHFKEWLQIRHPALVNAQGDLKLAQLSDQVFKEFFGHICKKRDKSAENEENPIMYLNPIQHQSFEHVSMYKSAIVNEYRKKRVPVSASTTAMLSDLFAGYKRTIGELKQNGEMSMTEGKVPLTFQAYNYLARRALAMTADFPLAMFAHLFLLLCWNLIARSVSVSSLMFNHISWEEDAMVFVFPTQKNDKEGKNNTKLHVYANPTTPEICPVLSMAIFLFCACQRRGEAKKTLFGTDACETRFSKWLRGICLGFALDLLNMGITAIEIGTHSFRKGVASFLSGLPGGPGPIAIYLRAGWSLGPVQSRYILDGHGNDQVCGRAATGLCLTDPSFATLPPHFNLINGPILSAEEWNDIVHGYATFYPECFRQVIPFLLASIVHHEEWLNATLAPNHPLRTSRVWTCGVIARLKSEVHTGCGHNKETRMRATGIPPHIVLANEIVEVRSALAAVRTELIAKLDNMPGAVAMHMRQEFAIDGVNQVTRSEVEQLVRSMEATLLTAIAAMRTEAVALRSAPPVPQGHIIVGGEHPYASFSWNGQLHNVPKDFRFPWYVPACLIIVRPLTMRFYHYSCDVGKIWDLWWDGDQHPQRRYAPYRSLCPKYDLGFAPMADPTKKNPDRKNFTRAKKVIEAIMAVGHVTSADVLAMSKTDRDACFSAAYFAMFRLFYTDKPDEYLDQRNIFQRQYPTVYDLINGCASL